MKEILGAVALTLITLFVLFVIIKFTALIIGLVLFGVFYFLLRGSTENTDAT